MEERIRIVSVPSGEAPLEVRKAWVGLELPIKEAYPHMQVTDVVSGKPRTLDIGYVVDFMKAMQILAAHDVAAHLWWFQRAGDDPENRTLVFDDACCILVTG